jgi:hypothetical protein
MDAAAVTNRMERYVRAHFNISAGDGRFGPTVDPFGGGYDDSVGSHS